MKLNKKKLVIIVIYAIMIAIIFWIMFSAFEVWQHNLDYAAGELTTYSSWNFFIIFKFLWKKGERL